MNPLPNYLFLDIETVPVDQSWEPEKELHQLFTKKTEWKGESSPSLWEKEAALYAEFGKICSVAIGTFNTKGEFYVKAIAGENELEILIQLTIAIKDCQAQTLVAHNGKEFDFPYIVRRCFVNAATVPEPLNTIGKKPWDVRLEDTMEMWSSTQWKHKISLELLCHLLKVESPKKILDGSSVSEMYFSNDLTKFDKIKEYNIGDVIALMKCYCKMKGVMLPETIKNVE